MIPPSTTSGTPDVAHRVERPVSVGEAAELLRSTSGSVLVRGAATQLDWGGRVDEPDLVVDTLGLDALLTHNPADMTVSVGAGMPLERLQQHLAKDRQFVAVDPAVQSRGATLGGLLASGDHGPRRLRYGALRDLVIGVTLVLPDGSVGRSGSHVIKNVAGYDLGKLAYGSLGSLALVAEVVLRLQPLPAYSCTVAVDADVVRATKTALALMASPLEPSAVDWVGAGLDGQLLVRTDGDEPVTRAQAARVVDLCRTTGLEPRTLEPDEAEAAWSKAAEATFGEAQDTVFRTTMLPTDLPALATALLESSKAKGCTATVVSNAAIGSSVVRLRGGTDADHAAVLDTVRGAVLARGGSVLLRSRPAGVDALVDALGPEPSHIELLRRLKHQFDPNGRLAPGRFRPWY